MNSWFNLEVWLHGLVGAFIGGGASSVSGGLVAMGIDPASFNLTNQLGHTLSLMGAMFLINGIFGAALYLKTSPVPNLPENK